MEKQYEGKFITEVWDYRLSTATPLIDRRGGTWVVKIYAKDNPDYDPSKPETLSAPLEEFDTKLPHEPGDERDSAKLSVCYNWLRSVRDKYSRPDIEELKPIVAKINAANAELAKRGAI